MSAIFNEGLKALAAVQVVCPGAILAGGYLRDSFLGKAPKDIDIFVPELGFSQTLALGRLGALHMRGAAEYMEQTEVDSIWDITGFALPVQVIALAPGLDPVGRAKAHDFGICQVWHHGGDSMEWTEAFQRDCMNETFTLVDCATKSDFARSMRRWERLKEKFPGFRLVVPPGFSHFLLQ